MFDPETLFEFAAVIGASTAIVGAATRFIGELERLFLGIANLVRVLRRRTD
jgi:hypothetical protein